MPQNLIMDDPAHRTVVVSYPATPVSGEPVRYGEYTGVALTAEGAGGNGATLTSVDFGDRAWDLSVQAANDGGNSAVAVGDKLYLTDTAQPRISKKVTASKFFGYADEALGTGLTGTIRVIHLHGGA